jgi:Tfp pilus assembly protein PilO
MREKKINTSEYIKMIRESSAKRDSYIFAGFTIIASILLIVFAIRPTLLTITRINSEIKEKERINNLLEEKINTLSLLDNEYSENKKSFEDLELIFPTSGCFSLFVANIEAVVARNGFALSSISFDNYRGKDYQTTTRVLVPQTIRLSVRGNDVNLVNLLRDIEGLPMYPTLDSVSYSQNKDEDGLGSFSMSLRVYTIEKDNFYK